jgi:serine protease Do
VVLGFALFWTAQLPADSAAESVETRPAPIIAPAAASVKREELPGSFLKDAPETLADLKAMEAHLKQVVARVTPMVVAVRVDRTTGSGVVISEDGYVLSVAHVGNEPNRNVQFTFPDGRTAKGKTLGTNHQLDCGLMKITDEGPWPHAAIGDLEQAQLGDWAIALGHPGGFDRERPIVVRLGRIIRLRADEVLTDCVLVGGDSGGPLFDMHGQVIAIHSRIGGSAAANYHVPVPTYLESWERLAKGENWGSERPPVSPYVGARGVDDPEGCRLEEVDENGPAFKAGVKIGDVVVKVNGLTIPGSAAFFEQIGKAKPGEQWTLALKRDGAELVVKLAVEAFRRGPRNR